MTLSIDEVRKQGKLAETAFCYTGDILDDGRQKYTLKYYTNLAKEMEKAGANIIAIKDMAGLLKPEAAYTLISALKDAVDLPIHLHSHEGGGCQRHEPAVHDGLHPGALQQPAPAADGHRGTRDD